MPRPVSEIESDIAAAKKAGEKPMGARMRALRAEKKEAEGIATPSSPAVAAPTPSTETVSAANHPDPFEADFEKRCAQSERSVLDSDEFRFIEKAVAETEIEFGTGSTTGAMKKLYNLLDAKLKLWRLAREIVQQVGLGNEWPQWAALGRDDATGRLKSERPAAPPPPPSPAPAPKVSDGGMPVRSARPSAADIMAQVTGGDPRIGVSQEIASRPEPVRRAVGVGA